jgi:hypothetical protein
MKGVDGMSSLYPIYVNYPIVPKPRFGGDLPRHSHLYDRINRNRPTYEAWLNEFVALKQELAQISLDHDPLQPEQPSWDNDWFSGLDAVALYGILAKHNPHRYYEIGSGFSTKFARRAVEDLGLRTSILSIDPFPRDEIDDICDEIIRKPLENTDIGLFEELESGDILFVDSSHYVFQNSDANIVFLEIMPRLKSGVMIHFHDIFLPDDYPASWGYRFYNEQYMLAAYLLAAGNSLEVIWPSYFISQDAHLMSLLQPIQEQFESRGIPLAVGASLWMTKK